MRRFALFSYVIAALALTILVASLVTRILEQDRTIAALRQRNTVLTHDVTRWTDIALRFEQLNRECLALCRGDQ